MKTLKTDVKDIRIGRLCQLKKDYKTVLFGQENAITVLLPKTLQVAVLPQSKIRPNLPLDNLNNDRQPILVNILACDENKRLRFEHLTTCCLIPVNMLEPTDEVFLNLLDLDWKAVEGIVQTYGINNQVIDQILGKSGVKELVVLIRKFGASLRSFLHVRCPICKKDTILNLAHDLRCQNKGCGHYFDSSPSSLKKMLPKSFKEIITDLK